jgi:hypothetical protein
LPLTHQQRQVGRAPEPTSTSIFRHAPGLPVVVGARPAASIQNRSPKVLGTARSRTLASEPVVGSDQGEFQEQQLGQVGGVSRRTLGRRQPPSTNAPVAPFVWDQITGPLLFYAEYRGVGFIPTTLRSERHIDIC